VSQVAHSTLLRNHTKKKDQKLGPFNRLSANLCTSSFLFYKTQFSNVAILESGRQEEIVDDVYESVRDGLIERTDVGGSIFAVNNQELLVGRGDSLENC